VVRGGPGGHLACARPFLLSGLQQRLLSSIPAFVRTLRRHLSTLQRHRDKAGLAATTGGAAAALIAQGAPDPEPQESVESESDLLMAVQSEEDDIAEAATSAVVAGLRSLDEAIQRVEGMLEFATANERKPDARVAWLTGWVRRNMFTGNTWNERRLIIFTEWEDTRLWLERRLKEAVVDTDRADERIATFTGITGQTGATRSSAHSTPIRPRAAFAFCSAPTPPAKASTCRTAVTTSSISTSLESLTARATQTAASIASCSRRRRCSAAISSTLSALRIACSQRWCARTRHPRTAWLRRPGDRRTHPPASRRWRITRAEADALARDIEAEQEDGRARLARREMDDDEERRLSRLGRELGQLNRELTMRAGASASSHRAQGRGGNGARTGRCALVFADDVAVPGAFRLDRTRRCLRATRPGARCSTSCARAVPRAGSSPSGVPSGRYARSRSSRRC